MRVGGEGRLVVVGLALGALAAACCSVVIATPIDEAEPVRLPSGPAATLDGWSVPDVGWQRSVVQVRTDRCGDHISGTGVVVDGRVLTNVHVVDGASEVTVAMHDGSEFGVRSIGVSNGTDVALLAVGDDGLGRGLRLTDGSGAVPGDALAMAGFPAGRRFEESVVVVAGVLRGFGFPDPPAALHLDDAVVPGQSGSPLVDRHGRVVALLYARAIADGNGLAIPAATLREAARDLSIRPLVVC